MKCSVTPQMCAMGLDSGLEKPLATLIWGVTEHFMRLDKLTTKFQEALADAQSLALANDHAYIEPPHLLAAMLRQEDGPRALLQRAGVNVPGLLAAAEGAMHKLTQVQGQEQIQVGRDLAGLLQQAETEPLKRN